MLFDEDDDGNDFANAFTKKPEKNQEFPSHPPPKTQTY
jgi:hypothetical protein